MLFKADFYKEMKGKSGAIGKRGWVLGAPVEQVSQCVLATSDISTLSPTRVIEILAYFLLKVRCL